VNGPWEKYGDGGSTATADGPWAKYGDQPKPKLASELRSDVPPALSPPKVPMHEVELFTGAEHTQHPLTEKIGELAGGALSSAGHMIAAAPVVEHRLLQRHGIMGERSRLFPGEHTAKEVEQQDVPNMVVSMLPGIAEGLEAAPKTFAPRGRTVPEVPKGAEKLAPEQVEAIDKANRNYKAAKSQVERRQGLETASKSMVQKTFDNLHTTHDAARGALDQQWSQFRQAMEGAELEPTEVFNNIEAAKAKYLKGSPASLQVFNNLAREMGIQDFMEGEGGTLKAILGTGKLPFDTARVHYSAIGDKLAQGNLPGNVYQALKAVSEGLDKQLTQAAESRNLGGDYTKLKANEHQFRSDWKDPKSPLARAYKSLSPQFLEQHVLNPAKGEYISNQLKRYAEHGAQPHLPLAAKRFASEAAEITKKVPEVKELPKAKAPAKGTMGRKAARIGGKLIGGTVGGAVGHPFLGYATGGEAGAEIYDRVTRPKTVPEPPDE
jgi:hypothetical protein